MARQGTAKQAIDARNANATTAPATTATTVNPMAETAMPATPTVTPVVTPSTPVTATPRVEGQWNYGSADAPVYAKPATASSTPATPATTPTQPLTTEIGREQALGQLAKQPEAQTRQAEIKSVRENLKDDSGKQLWSNMEGISNTNANLLNNRRDFDEAFGYKAKDAGEKAMVDSFWRAKNKMDSKSLYNALETGETIPKESIKTPQFEDAVIRKQSVNKFENLTPFQLSKQLNTNLIPGTQAYNDLMAKNPKLVSDANKLSSINMSVTARQPAKTDYMEMLSNFFTQSQTMQQPATVAKIMNSDPSIGAKTTEVQALDGELNEAKMRLKNLQADVTERYKGTGASKSTIRAKALAESQDLIDEIAMIEANRSSASSALSTLIQNAKDDYAMARQDRQDAIESQQKQVANLMAFAKMGIEQDNEEYKRAFDQYKYDTDYLRSEASKDSDFAREMEKLDIQNQYLAERDDIGYQRDVQLAKMGYGQQERMANMGYQNQRDMANIGFEQGMYEQGTKAQSDLIKELVSKGTSYQEAVSQVMGGTVGGALGDIRHMAGQFPNQAWAKNNNPAGITWNANFDNPKPGTTAYTLQQAGIKYSKGTARPANEGGNYVTFDTIEDGLAAQRLMMTQTYGNSTVSQMLQKWVGTSEGPRYAAQVAGNAGVNLNAKVSSLSDEQLQQLQMAKVQKESSGLYKLLQSQPKQPAPTQQGFSANGRNYTEDDINVLGEIRAILEKTPTEGRKALKDAGYTLEDIAMLNSGKMPQTSTQRKSAMEVISDIGGLVNMDWNDATGTFASWGGFSGGDSATANTKIESLVSKLTMPNLGMLKGPMSDKDLAFITSASANLNNKQSDASFEKRLIEYYNISARIAGIPEAKSLENIKRAVNGQQNPVQPTQGGSTAPSVPNRFEALYNQL